MRSILFVTGTRADYGKIKELMKKVQGESSFDLKIFVTGMHMLSRYGSTHLELEKDGFKDLYKFINQIDSSNMDMVLSNTIQGISNYIHEYKVDLIVVHGDRVEALAGAIVGALNNIRVAHVEGGEISGTIDESIRHAVSKFSHLHFVAHEEARDRLVQLGEAKDNIYVIGSPDIDVMLSDTLPSLLDVREKYGITFQDYSVLMYHPVTTECRDTQVHVSELVDAVLESGRNYVVIFPNNDTGSQSIISEYERFEGNEGIKVFPSIKFEFFLTLLKNASFLLGNSSAGIREAGIYGVPAIDLGSRQKGRYRVGDEGILHVEEIKEEILLAIEKAEVCTVPETMVFGNGDSSCKFIHILKDGNIWDCPIQKRFIDME